MFSILFSKNITVWTFDNEIFNNKLKNIKDESEIQDEKFLQSLRILQNYKYDEESEFNDLIYCSSYKILSP